MTSLPSDLLEAPASGVSKPTCAVSDHSSASPEFSTVYGHVVSTAEFAEMDSSPNEAPIERAYDAAMAPVADGPDSATVMEIQAMTPVGNHTDMASVSSDAAAQIGTPSNRVAQDMATGDACETVKNGILGLPTTSFEDASRKVPAGDDVHLDDFSPDAATGGRVDVTRDSPQALPTTQITSALVGSVDSAIGASQGIDHVTVGGRIHFRCCHI